MIESVHMVPQRLQLMLSELFKAWCEKKSTLLSGRSVTPTGIISGYRDYCLLENLASKHSVK